MIKVYLFKEDPPLFNINIGPVTLGLTKRNLIYVSSIGLLPSLYLFLAILGVGNLIIALIIELIALLTGYSLSIIRIENIPFDRFIYNKIVFMLKKDKYEEVKNSINFTSGSNFENIVRTNIKNLLNKD